MIDNLPAKLKFPAYFSGQSLDPRRSKAIIRLLGSGVF
jgi:hypothetical protein